MFVNTNTFFAKQMNKKYDGIALVAVLAVLTVLALLAALFAVNLRIEQKMAHTNLIALQNNLLVISASEHAEALLEADKNVFDSKEDIWYLSNDQQIFYVKDETGMIIGRYKLSINDESGKINVNTANLRLNKKSIPAFSKHTGPSKVALNSVNNGGTLLSSSAAKKMVLWRYGKNHCPGRANFDDNGNAAFLSQDGVDNDGDGLIDEIDEGIDEPEECTHPIAYGDDRYFSSIDELAGVISLTQPAMQFLKKNATGFSIEGEPVSNKPVNVSASSPRKLLRAFKDAKLHTEYKVSKLRNLACNISDYADENNVLATLGNAYGVEAVCFNEILANDGSVIAPVQAYDKNIKLGEKRVPRAGAAFTPLYSSYNVSKNPDNPSLVMYNRNRRDSKSWYVCNKPRFLTSLAGTTARIRLDESEFNANGLATSSERKKMLSDYKKVSGGRWPVNLYKGGYIEFPYDNEDFLTDEINFPGVDRKHMYVGAALFKIVRSGPKVGEFTIETKGYDALPDGNSRSRVFDPKHYKKNAFARPLANFTNAHCNLTGWQYFDISGDWTSWENISEQWIFPAELPEIFELNPNTYYKVSIHSRSDNFDDPIWGDERNFVEYYVESKNLDTDGDYNTSSSAEMWRRRFPYMEGMPQRTSGKATMPIVLTSSDECTARAGMQRISRLYSVMFTRPEVIELKNVSKKPISLRNWTLVSNSGSLNIDISKFTQSLQYYGTTKGNISDNPVIGPGGYFYIVNDEAIFDYEFGSSKNGKWGTVSTEQTPVFPIDKKTLWGIHYKIQKVDAEGSWNNAQSSIQVANENWQPDQLKGEFIEIVKKDTPPFPDDLHNADGIRLMITRNTKNKIYFEGVYLPVPDAANYGAGEGGEYVTTKDEFYICGLPRKGGFVSLTLKNEYNQICSRTAKYGDVTGNSPGRKNEGWSTEKVDPTHYTWLPNKNPTFSGIKIHCRNKAAPRTGVPDTIIKNRNFVSKAELLNVKKSQDWENIGDAKGIYESRNLMKKLAPTITTDSYILCADARNSHKQGWKLAGGSVVFTKRGILKAKNTNWKNGTWIGHSLKFITGKLAGESFPIADNSKNTVSVFLPGVHKNVRFSPSEGDQFALGPAYSSPLYYTENDGEPGVWEWQLNNINPNGKYELSLRGLNDSISTTEFLEENHNAKLDVELWDFDEKSFVKLRERSQYNKNDLLYVGNISKPFISNDGKIRIQITPHNLQNQDCSGKAWFNFAVLSPKRVCGRININTATEKVLLALDGITKPLAKNIAEGIGFSGKCNLKPYSSVGDLLNIKGMTPETFYLLCPQTTVRSAAFSAEITAETLKNTENKNIHNLDNNNVEGKTTATYYFEREKNDDGTRWNIKLIHKTK